jgi:phospholipase/carboxylesterase
MSVRAMPGLRGRRGARLAAGCVVCLVALSAGPGATAVGRPGQTDGVDAPLELIEYLPDAFDPEREYPLVLALHGFGASAADWEWTAPAFTRRGVILVAAQAPYVFDRGDREGRDWFNSHTRDRDIVDATVPRTIAALLETVRVLRQRHRVSEMYLLGFSQGGRLTYVAGPGQHELIDGLVIFGAGFDSNAMDEAAVRASAGRMRVFIGHGLSDRIDLSNATSGRDYLRRAGYDVTFQSFTGGHEVPPAMIRRTVDWVLEGR